jgi:ribonuclease HI
MIGISCEALSEKYLGLPTVVGRAKNGAFKNLPERSWGKVKGWKGQGLSKAGKETLVKSVLQAVPTYTMGCFQLTKSMCQQLTSISAGFWWGAADGKRKVHWISWDKMCATKRNGGLGFRSYPDFNQALLAKQAWRMVTKPDSLCASVLKARYFPNGNFLSAGCPKNASFTWKSMMHGRELLKAGLIWRIGDGSKVSIWKDNCIPRASAQKPLGHKPDVEVEMVHELLLPDGNGWDMDKLQNCFYDVDVDDIAKIPVGRAGTDDYIAWNYTKNGNFSVKSAYHLKMQLNSLRAGRASSSSASCDDHRGWLALWAADVPNKVKVHAWRLVKNGLAVGHELARRKIKMGVRCVVCFRDETMIHRFWRCPYAARTWECMRELTSLPLDAPPDRVYEQKDLASWMLEWMGKTNDRELALGLMTLYQMWLARNDARDAELIEDPMITARKTVFLVDEWQIANTSPPASRSNQEAEHWLAPPDGWHKVNADGAFLQVSGRSGGGAVLRDHHGEFVAGSCHFFPRVLDPEGAELLACKEATQLALDQGINKLVLETDCLSAVSKLRGKELDRSLHGPLVQEIKVLLSSFSDTEVQHVRRSANGVAHCLAKFGCENNICNTWVGVPPMYCMNLLAYDYGGI